jgi:hypothetical protein
MYHTERFIAKNLAATQDHHGTGPKTKNHLSRSPNHFHREQPLTNVLEKLKALDAQRSQLLDDAKKEALDNAERAVAELNELGFHYALVESAATTSPARAPRKTASQAPKRQARDVPCPICHFKTTPHHDGRLHRSQKSKKPFTVEELMEKGLSREEFVHN